MSDESILGLLLRAHAECAAQEHGEKYVFNNISSSCCWDQAKRYVQNAIKQVELAEVYIAKQEDRKER